MYRPLTLFQALHKDYLVSFSQYHYSVSSVIPTLKMRKLGLGGVKQLA